MLMRKEVPNPCLFRFATSIMCEFAILLGRMGLWENSAIFYYWDPKFLFCKDLFSIKFDKEKELSLNSDTSVAAKSI